MKIFKKKLPIISILLLLIVVVISLAIFSSKNDTNVKYSEISKLKLVDDIFISEDNYIQEMKEKVEVNNSQLIQNGYFDGSNNEKIYYEIYPVEDSKGSIVISHGYSEYLERYEEMIYYFTKMGYSVFALEHRGHGNSSTLGVEDESQIFVEYFDYYVEDLKLFLHNIVTDKIREDEKLFLFAHSMGGGIGTLFLERYPEYFDAAILSAPMLEIHTGGIPEFLAKTIAWGADVFGLDGKYILGKGPYKENYDLVSSGTSSEERYEYMFNNLVEDEYAQRGDGAFKWLHESFKATSEAIKEENASKVKIPVLLFQAGNDTYVKSGGQDQFATFAPNCEIIRFEDGKHELYRENDDILLGYLNTLFDFYEKNL